MNSLVKSLCFCFIVLVYSAVAIPKENVEPKYSRYIQFPNENGVLETVDLKEKPNITLLSDISANNRYFLYTRRNPSVSQTLRLNNIQSITLSNFNANNPTVVIVHGWFSNKNRNINSIIRNVYLVKSDVNVIVMDWSRFATTFYTTTVAGVPEVGRGLGRFLKFLHDVTGAPFENMHLIGHSLGAHIVGNAGRELKGRVARITGLDPAGPLWILNGNRLKVGDAIYVDAIHTDARVLGIGLPIANADFFVNSGTSQPGCLTFLCDHERAWELFAATVTYNHLLGIQCANMIDVVLNRCSGRILPMGNGDLKKTGSGLYSVRTHEKYPF